MAAAMQPDSLLSKSKKALQNIFNKLLPHTVMHKENYCIDNPYMQHATLKEALWLWGQKKANFLHKPRESSLTSSLKSKRWNLLLRDNEKLKTLLMHHIWKEALYCRHRLRQLRAHSSRWRQVSLLATDARNEVWDRSLRRAGGDTRRLIRREIRGGDVKTKEPNGRRFIARLEFRETASRAGQTRFTQLRPGNYYAPYTSNVQHRQ